MWVHVRTASPLTSTHNLCFRAKIRKDRYTPAYPSFSIYKWGLRGYTFHGHVFLMLQDRTHPTLTGIFCPTSIFISNLFHHCFHYNERYVSKWLTLCETKTAVTHQRISETRAGRVEKIAKFHIRHTHVGDTFETRYEYALYAWCTSGARRCTSLKIIARFVRVWDQKILNMFKNFLEARRVPGV